jgi:protein-tyrosine phosphatase
MTATQQTRITDRPLSVPRSRTVPSTLEEHTSPRGRGSRRLIAATAAALALAGCAETPEYAGDARRHVVLEGADNFRDLGGYRTVDGRAIRWRMLYRSDDLAELTPDDLATLGTLGIRVVCNLRSGDEGVADRLPEQNPPLLLDLPIGTGELAPSRVRGRILSGDVDGDQLERLLTAEYRAFVTHFSRQYAAMFARLAAPDQLPTLVHCTRGKDRTGFAAAIVLLALGVPHETVIEDYMLTNLFTASDIRWTVALAFVGSLFRVTPGELRPLLEARPEYLEAAFAAATERYGSIEGYLRDGLGVTDELRDRLRTALLE